MEYRFLGNTNIKVSRICFGSLTISPLQSNLPVEQGASVIKYAFEKGINFIDTAELYDNYKYIKSAIKGHRDDYILSTKCYAYSKEGAKESLEKALKELDTDYIDIFSLHEQESAYTIKGHWEAIEYFIKAKEKGYIRAFGISTHNVSAVKASLDYKEIEILHPIYNKAGLGIVDGTVDDMGKAIEEAYKRGKGIYSMKPLGGGNLLDQAEDCIKFVLKNKCIHSIAIGMQSIEEIDYNTAVFDGITPKEELVTKLKSKKRKLLIDFWCEGCGACVKACSQGAIFIKDGKAHVKEKECVLCGYCSKHCEQFCIKII